MFNPLNGVPDVEIAIEVNKSTVDVAEQELSSSGVNFSGLRGNKPEELFYICERLKSSHKFAKEGKNINIDKPANPDDLGVSPAKPPMECKKGYFINHQKYYRLQLTEFISY